MIEWYYDIMIYDIWYNLIYWYNDSDNDILIWYSEMI